MALSCAEGSFALPSFLRRSFRRTYFAKSNDPTNVLSEYTVEVIQLVPQERIQERIAEQDVDIPLPQIMEEMMEVVLFSTTYASESYSGTDRGRLHSPDSGGNFRVGVMLHAFHLAQILRAHDSRSQV